MPPYNCAPRRVKELADIKSHHVELDPLPERLTPDETPTFGWSALTACFVVPEPHRSALLEAAESSGVLTAPPAPVEPVECNWWPPKGGNKTPLDIPLS